MDNTNKIMLTIKEEIFSKRFDGETRVIKFKDFDIDLQPDDIIEIHREEPFYSDNNSYDGSTTISVHRTRERTEEEKQELKEYLAKRQEDAKHIRYVRYLELKEEFENKSKDEDSNNI